MTQRNGNKSEGRNATRRTVLKTGLAVSAAAVGISSSGIGLAQSEMDLSLEVDAEAETVTITNNGESEVDLTGYQINFEAGTDSEVNQIRTLSGEVVIGAGESVTVAAGGGESGDVSLEDPYEGEVLNNENPDVVALLSPEDEEVARSDESGDSDDDDNEGGDDNEEKETYTLTASVIESEDNGIISADVTVDGETKTTSPQGKDDNSKILATFELENGTYTASATYDVPDETWESDEEEVEIDGEDETVSLTVYPPDADESEDNDSDDSDESDDGTSDDSDEQSNDEEDESVDDDCPEEEPEPEPEDDCPEKEPEPEPENDCPDE